MEVRTGPMAIRLQSTRKQGRELARPASLTRSRDRSATGISPEAHPPALRSADGSHTSSGSRRGVAVMYVVHDASRFMVRLAAICLHPRLPRRCVGDVRYRLQRDPAQGRVVDPAEHVDVQQGIRGPTVGGGESRRRLIRPGASGPILQKRRSGGGPRNAASARSGRSVGGR